MDILDVLGAIIPPAVTAAGGWWFGRRKTNAEAVTSEMDNVDKALAIYRTMITDLGEKILALEERVKKLQAALSEAEDENRRLKRQQQA